MCSPERGAVYRAHIPSSDDMVRGAYYRRKSSATNGNAVANTRESTGRWCVAFLSHHHTVLVNFPLSLAEAQRELRVSRAF
jgi:hypothetical protein